MAILESIFTGTILLAHIVMAFPTPRHACFVFCLEGYRCSPLTGKCEPFSFFDAKSVINAASLVGDNRVDDVFPADGGPESSLPKSVASTLESISIGAKQRLRDEENFLAAVSNEVSVTNSATIAPEFHLCNLACIVGYECDPTTGGCKPINPKPMTSSNKEAHRSIKKVVKTKVFSEMRVFVETFRVHKSARHTSRHNHSSHHGGSKTSTNLSPDSWQATSTLVLEKIIVDGPIETASSTAASTGALTSSSSYDANLIPTGTALADPSAITTVTSPSVQTNEDLAINNKGSSASDISKFPNANSAAYAKISPVAYATVALFFSATLNF